MLSIKAVVCFSAYFYIRQLNSLLNLYKDASGMWHEDRFRPLCAALTNLILNLVFVQIWGIYGVLLSTVIAILVVGIPWLLHNLFTVIFNHEQLNEYLIHLAKYVFISILICVISYICCSCINSIRIMTLVYRFIICCVLTNGLYYLVFRSDTEFRKSIALVNNMTKGKYKKVLNRIVK